MSPPRAPALWFAVFVVFIDALGMSIIIPIMPDLLTELSGRAVAESAMIGGAMASVYALNQFLFGPIVGALSDRFGRRPLILISLTALMLDYILMAVAWTVWLLFLGRFLAGLAGASYTVATAYIADISSKEKRAANFGLVGAAFGLGFVIGPALGGIAAEISTRAPLWLAAGLSGVGVLFGLFVLPESLKPENRRAFSLRGANPFSALFRAFSLPGLGALLLVYILMQLADFTYPAIWAFWGRQTFGWDASMIGWTLAFYGISSALVQGGLIRWIIPRFGESLTVRLGLLCAVSAFFVLGFTQATWIVFAGIPIAALAHVAGAALSGMMANRVGDDTQGELQGVLGAVGAVSSVIAYPATTAIFAAYADDQGLYLPGMPYLLAGALTVAALLLFELRKPRAATPPPAQNPSG